MVHLAFRLIVVSVLIIQFVKIWHLQILDPGDAAGVLKHLAIHFPVAFVGIQGANLSKL